MDEEEVDYEEENEGDDSVERVDATDLEVQDPKDEEPGDDSADRGLTVFDPVHRYLVEIRKYPFLSKEEEHRLAILSKSTSDPPPEESMMAITTLVLSHLRLVASIAMEYKHLPFDTMDFIQEGNIGLMQAIKKFDPYREIRVATYATWWIRAYILKYIIQNWRLVRIGTTEVQRKLFFNLSKERERLEKQGYIVGPKLLADHFHVKEKEVIDVEQRLSWGQEVSLSETVGEEGEKGSNTRLLHQIASDAPQIEQQFADEQIKELFQSKLKLFYQTLNSRDAEILSHRVLSEDPMTLEMLGTKYSVSKERVRQLEENLIKKLKKFIKREVKDFNEILP